MKKPIILTKGSIPDCVHYEQVVGLIGTCVLCGQVRNYRPCWGQDDDLNSVFQEKGRRGQVAATLAKNKKRDELKAGVYG